MESSLSFAGQRLNPCTVLQGGAAITTCRGGCDSVTRTYISNLKAEFLQPSLLMMPCNAGFGVCFFFQKYSESPSCPSLFYSGFSVQTGLNTQSMLCAWVLARGLAVKKKKLEVIKSLTFTANLVQALCTFVCTCTRRLTAYLHTERELQGPPPALAGLGISGGCTVTCTG